MSKGYVTNESAATLVGGIKTDGIVKVIAGGEQFDFTANGWQLNIASGSLELYGLRIPFFRDVEVKPEASFTINAGDYIDSREFTREECERFCEIAVECGAHYEHATGFANRYMMVNPDKGCIDSCKESYWNFSSLNNITTQFREFLDKEKGKVFTKDNLLSDRFNGVSIWYENDENSPYIKTGLRAYSSKRHPIYSGMDNLNKDLVSSRSGRKVLKVTDRDGTVLFEREEETRELTIEEIAAKFGLPVERVRIKK